MMKAAGNKKRVKRCFSITLSFRITMLAFFCLFTFNFCLAQEVVDKTVATVNSGGSPELITYSDLLWQIALEPDTPVENPSSESLNRTLQLIINQRIIHQEAARLPTIAPTDKEIDDATTELIKHFPSRTEFYDRVRRVGLSGDQLKEIVRQRVEIEKYLDFRFRSFTIVTPKEVEDYYTQVYVPRVKRQQPGRIIPNLEEARAEIERTLTESKIESDIDAFLDAARERAEIVILNPV